MPLSDQLELADGSFCRAYQLCSAMLTKLAEAQKKTFPGGGGWVVGSAENKANSAQLELGLGLSLAKTIQFNGF